MSALTLTTVLIHSIETWGKKKKKTRARKSLSDHLFHSRHFTDEETEVSPEAATCPSPGYHLVAKQESQLALNLS